MISIFSKNKYPHVHFSQPELPPPSDTCVGMPVRTRRGGFNYAPRRRLFPRSRFLGVQGMMRKRHRRGAGRRGWRNSRPTPAPCTSLLGRTPSEVGIISCTNYIPFVRRVFFVRVGQVIFICLFCFFFGGKGISPWPLRQPRYFLGTQTENPLSFRGFNSRRRSSRGGSGGSGS